MYFYGKGPSTIILSYLSFFILIGLIKLSLDLKKVISHNHLSRCWFGRVVKKHLQDYLTFTFLKWRLKASFLPAVLFKSWVQIVNAPFGKVTWKPFGAKAKNVRTLQLGCKVVALEFRVLRVQIKPLKKKPYIRSRCQPIYLIFVELVVLWKRT